MNNAARSRLPGLAAKVRSVLAVVVACGALAACGSGSSRAKTAETAAKEPTTAAPVITTTAPETPAEVYRRLVVDWELAAVQTTGTDLAEAAGQLCDNSPTEMGTFVALLQQTMPAKTFLDHLVEGKARILAFCPDLLPSYGAAAEGAGYPVT